MIVRSSLLASAYSQSMTKARARTVGLHHDAEAVPAGQPRIGQHALDDVERQVEPVGLLRVDVQAHAGVPRGERQGQQPLGSSPAASLPSAPPRSADAAPKA